MRNLFFAIPILMLGLLAGCVWPPDSTEVPPFYPPYLSYDIHRISQRSLAGVETVSTIVSPSANEYSAYPDSLLYILVNDDTVFRHPTITSTPVLDSSAPYRFDGSTNIVVFIFPSESIFDTSYVYNVSAQITSPPYGDTIKRTTDALFAYQTDEDGYGGNFQITDSINFYSQPLDSYNETLDFPANEMETLRAGTLWADLQVQSVAESSNTYYNYIENRTVELDRIVAYPLQ
jgi:hypothetical protein